MEQMKRRLAPLILLAWALPLLSCNRSTTVTAETTRCYLVIDHAPDAAAAAPTQDPRFRVSVSIDYQSPSSSALFPLFHTFASTLPSFFVIFSKAASKTSARLIAKMTLICFFTSGGTS